MNHDHRRLVKALLLAFLFASVVSLRAQTPTLRSALQIGGSGLELGTSIDHDAGGNLVVVGSYSSTVDFDPGVATASLTAIDSADGFVAKYDSAGNHLWSIGIGGSGQDGATFVAVDGGGNVVVRGTFRNTVDFDPGPGTASLTATTGATDVFIAKYTPTGNHLWSFRLPVSLGYGLGLAIDATGGIMICGNFRGTVDFDPGAGRYAMTATGSSNDLYVAKYSATGGFLWAFRIGSDGFELANALAIDDAGNFYVSGYFGSTTGPAVNFNPAKGTKVNLSSQGGPDLFLAKFAPDRRLLWALSAGGTGADQGLALAVDGGGVVVTGMFGGTGDFNPGAGTALLTSTSMQDVLVAKYSTAGAYQWALGVSAPCGSTCQGGWGRAVAIDANGDVHVGGNYKGSADFDPGTGTAVMTSEPSDAMNCFAATYTSAGAFVSSFGIPSTTSSHGALDIAPNGDVVVYGSFSGSIDLDPGEAIATLTSAGLVDDFVARYSTPTMPKRAIARASGARVLRIW
jgi:hypothetical protein